MQKRNNTVTQSILVFSAARAAANE